MHVDQCKQECKDWYARYGGIPFRCLKIPRPILGAIAASSNIGKLIIYLCCIKCLSNTEPKKLRTPGIC